MTPPVLQLPLDLSGTAATNKVAAELHAVAATGTRAFATLRGPFFTRGLVVRDNDTGVTLVPDVDYRPVHMFLEASLRSTQEVCSVIILLPTCPTVAPSVDYQAIGGEYSASVASIEQLIESLDLDSRTVRWGDLLGAPEYFPPTAHLHDIGDLYGFEYVVAALEQLRRAIILGDQAAFDEMRQYIDAQDNTLRGLIGGFDSLFNSHIQNTNNPHVVTKAQIGLSSVQNYGVASTVQAQAGTADNVYMTPLKTAQAIQTLVGAKVDAHIANANNPHNTTKAQVGLGSVNNYDFASQLQAEQGQISTAYMTPWLTGKAIAFQAVVPLNNHIARTDNPHGVSKAQVGLSLVDNYATATPAQTQTGTATNLFVTPAGLKYVLDNGLSGQFAAHIARTDNPHSVTKTQIGLGNVTNNNQVINSGGNVIYLKWAGSEIQAQVDATAMGRIHTTAQPDPNIAAHSNRTDNPHNTTQAQVGLGNVQNLPLAGQADAESGASNGFYMTPLRTKQAITAQAVNPLQTQISQRVVINSDAQLNSLSISSVGYLYNSSGNLVARVGGNRYFIFGSNGNFTASNGRVIAASGFQPSDRRFKKGLHKVVARPLWRGFTFKGWENTENQQSERGVVAQELLKVAEDRVFLHDFGLKGRKKMRYVVDYLGTAFEMAYAAGQENDRLRKTVDAQGKLIEQLSKRLAALEAKR